MPYLKTDRALAALQDRSGGLRPAERQLLILCNGRHGADDLRAMFGPSADATIARLVAAGYLQQAAPAAPVPEPQVADLAPDVGSTRRSMVAAKMYMVGILELIRDPLAGDCIRALRGAADEAALLGELIAALAFVARKSPDSYGGKVAERLGEILPLSHLPALQRARAGRFDDAEAAA